VQKKLCNDEQSNENAIKKRKQKKGKNEKWKNSVAQEIWVR
jgi:hypothetical protein